MKEVQELADLREIQSVHMIGIGGIGMSALAHILLDQGIRVFGSDREESDTTRRLRDRGAVIMIGHQASNVRSVDWLVYSAAIPKDNPEREEALLQKIPEMDRASLLGKIMKLYPHSVAVAGSHGKTTTTALLSCLLEWAELDPTVLVGGYLNEISGNVKVGKSPYLVTEACEYHGSFLRFPPRIGIVLNIDLDHLDYFENLAAIQAVFGDFVAQLPPEGLLVMNGDDENSAHLSRVAACPVIRVGLCDNCDLKASQLEVDTTGCYSFDVHFRGKPLGRFSLGIPGKHHIHNGLTSLAVALELGVSPHHLKETLPKFRGLHRRFESLGNWQDVTVVDDYAHHPAEILATLQTARSAVSPKGKVYCIFQPHTYTRTLALLSEFADALALADGVVVTDIFAAREPDRGLIHSQDLVKEIRIRGGKAVYAPLPEDSAREAASLATAGDMILTVGAGPVNELAPLLEKQLKAMEMDNA
ncbi:UDP-N-acetylmuramate--L-alanine ligase [Tindallia magadiensis]|uniref:UDP-N-acetylmuramate--L-alanine ligase n=1 Tax=Tindallia magadiensis TaxID=69895 RepID=A0A1I3CZ20_9FIRM|nr:UDP-N-acetylmuramate--L-alanine ligase [Tindallia magadiensis]SFH79491.1 UDP-N-acetylmuramate--L-alanine ligase [Tindallia magadiensis]